MHKHHSATFGIILVVVGIVFLLGNFNVPVFRWIVGLWPIILIYWGLRRMSYDHKEDCDCYFCRHREEYDSEKSHQHHNHQEEKKSEPEEVVVEEEVIEEDSK